MYSDRERKRVRVTYVVRLASTRRNPLKTSLSCQNAKGSNLLRLALSRPKLYQPNILFKVTIRLPTWLSSPAVLTRVLYWVLSPSSAAFETHVTWGRFLCAVMWPDAMVTGERKFVDRWSNRWLNHIIITDACNTNTNDNRWSSRWLNRTIITNAYNNNNNVHACVCMGLEKGVCMCEQGA